jgi:hypothetical protein
MLAEALYQLVGDDPKMRQLVDLYQAHQKNQESTANEQDTQQKKLLLRLRKASHAYRSLQAKLEQLEERLNDCVEVNDELAAALGACPDCWGRKRECPSCHGRGKIGHEKPDPLAFEQYILPLFRRSRWACQQVTTPHAVGNTLPEE